MTDGAARASDAGYRQYPNQSPRRCRRFKTCPTPSLRAKRSNPAFVPRIKSWIASSLRSSQWRMGRRAPRMPATGNILTNRHDAAAGSRPAPPRHCERSEAIQLCFAAQWIASSLRSRN